MKARSLCLLALVVSAVAASPRARADEVADKKAEIQRKKDEAKKQAAEKQKAAAEAKAAADAAAAADKKAADAKKAADDKKAAAEKAAADKKAAAGSGGSAATGTGGASSTAAGGATSASSGGTTATAGAAVTGGVAATGGTGGAAAVKSPLLIVGDIEALRKDRAERRKVTVEQLRKRWGSLLADPKGAADLKDHSRRVAFLQRARLVAQAKKDTKSVERVDQLLTEEDERHGNAMNSLREGAIGAGTTK